MPTPAIAVDSVAVVSRRRISAVVGAIGALFLGASSAGAQTPDLPTITQDVVVTATVSPTDLVKVSRAVTILSREDLDLMGIRSIIEGLRFVPGVDARARGPQDVQTDFSIRGATFGQNLILADGMRLNDSQSGHHNGEIPLPVVAVDRIEVVAGAGSAVHGADALGGTINVVSRRGDVAEAGALVGEHGYAAAQVAFSGYALPENWLVTGWTSRSAGFAFDRDFALGGVAVRGTLRPGLTVDVRHQRRAFGANGFYGPSPSKVWTDLTMGGLSWRQTVNGWTVGLRGHVRDHGDHFRWDINRPGFAENRHRTRAGETTFDASRVVPHGTIAFGVSGSGDFVRSTNLGDRNYGRGSAFAEWLVAAEDRASAQVGLRIDQYSAFGRAVSPSVSSAVMLSPELRARASFGRAFRVPTFTELYYTDPSNLGSPNLQPERSWSLDGGLDWTRRAWSANVTVFRRWDADVIDWVRPTSADVWRSTNVRDVKARGFEASITRRWSEAFIRVHYAGLHLDAPQLNLLSKYVLEYARHQSGGSLTLPVGFGFRAALNVDHRHRRDGQSYDLVSARLSRAVGRLELSVDGTNLLDADYHEVSGVEMPGRWLMVGIAVR